MARHRKHTYVDGKRIMHKMKGMNKTEIATQLYPYYEERQAAYRHLKEQLIAGSMPTDMYNMLMEIIDGSVQ